MGLLDGLFGSRPSGDDEVLGRGVWRRASDRFSRAVDRFIHVVEGIDADALGRELTGATVVRDSLATNTHVLAGLADQVHELCVSAQRLAPTDRLEIPGGPDGSFPELHRHISRAATCVAQAAEAATMARVSLRADSAQATERAAGADRAITAASGNIEAARKLLARHLR
ncbi:hypothetical protein LWF01_14130 [Saxibacter everestensis]|uniref:Uncharacterized protein n=1 Tax=Saxibacter everestensis TaxID=2909229 RepID=A0ABY8QQG0_9MICO|nr:hypothetical protein LWF01_14130 [Brevibacteriaceae bacterium ZFBP1038]